MFIFRECNSRNSVIEVLNMFYVAVLVFILKVWISEKKTIKDSGYLLKGIFYNISIFVNFVFKILFRRNTALKEK